MTTIKFDQVPTAIEETNVKDIQVNRVEEAWKAYEAKPEYKEFNKHDLIESMLNSKESEQHKK